ncbi:IS3 family transposase, partial [Aedoeadaptatus coxii]|uniref:IS3 family transposase n=1 Tax=Aedoeadaptatus coxii TaxID=755172 RepID=UPI002AA2B6B2
NNEQKARIVAKLREQFQLTKILAAINFPKSTFMYWQKKWSEKDKDQALKDEILSIRHEHKDYGYRKIHLELKNRGWSVNKKKVQRLIQVMGLQVLSYGRKYKKYNSYKGVVGHIKKNRINRRFNTSIPYQKITTDTTEFKYYEKDQTGKLQTKKLYLDPYMDLYNLEIISYVLSDQPNGVTML